MLRKEWDISQGQIASAVRNNIKVKNQRKSTVNNLGKATRMEEMMESASRKVFRGLMMKKSAHKQVEELEKKVEEAARIRAQAELDEQMADEYTEPMACDDDEDEELMRADQVDAERKTDMNFM
jgi:hypothetical protein